MTRESTYHFPEYRAKTLEMRPLVSTVTASSSAPDPMVRAFSALKFIFKAMFDVCINLKQSKLISEEAYLIFP
jgi:hypothetical protein